MGKVQVYVQDLDKYEVWNDPYLVTSVKDTFPQAKKFDSFLAQVIDDKLIVWGYYGKVPYPQTPLFKIY